MIKIPPIESMSDAFDVNGKNIVVTGGNRGIGLGISTAFAQSGANVVILCRNGESGRKAAENLAQYGGRHTCIEVDITDRAAVAVAAKRVYEFFDRVDVLVNNAGVATTTGFFTPSGLDEWDRVIGTNLFGTANVVYSIVPGMRDSGHGGLIITIISNTAFSVAPARTHENSPYFASKAALNIFSKYLAITLGESGIRSISLSPGLTHSDLDGDLPPDVFDAINNDLPMRRFGEPIEIGALCVFLASPAGVYITGTVIAEDGGVSII